MKITKLSNGMGSIRINQDVAERLSKALSNKFRTRVGILGSKTERLAQQPGETHSKYKQRVRKWLKDREGGSGGMTNAEIGLIHEKGSVTRGIPRRSFLEVPLMNGLQKVDRAGKVLQQELNTAIAADRDPEGAWKKAHRDLGIIGEQIVQKAFEDHGPGWKEDAPATIARKKSESPLIDTGQLRRSIMSDVVERKE
jgi:hypothetical protein